MGLAAAATPRSGASGPKVEANWSNAGVEAGTWEEVEAGKEGTCEHGPDPRRVLGGGARRGGVVGAWWCWRYFFFPGQ